MLCREGDACQGVLHALKELSRLTEHKLTRGISLRITVITKRVSEPCGTSSTVINRKPTSALHHSPVRHGRTSSTPGLLRQEWTTFQRVCKTLSSHQHRHALRLAAALLTTDDEDNIVITNKKLRRALTTAKATAPGVDGIT